MSEQEWLLLNSIHCPNLGNSVKEVKIDVDWCVKDMFFMPSDYAEAHADEERAKCRVTVYVQRNGGTFGDGDLRQDLNGKLVILTVHDVGTNPLHSFIPFINSAPMAPFREKPIAFLHVCVPGQEIGAENFDGNFPTMDQMAEMMPQVLDHFGIKRCVAVGEGAGADVVCRFALEFSDMLAGIVLLHPTSSTHGILGNLKEILANIQLEDGKMNAIAWDYLLAHKFGGENSRERRQHWMDQIRRRALNEHNLSRFLYSFSYRSDFTDMLKQQLLKVHAILVTGGKSPHNKNVFHMYEQMDKSITALLVAEDAADVLMEAPEYVAQALTRITTQWHRPPSPPSPVGMDNREKNNFEGASTMSLHSFSMDNTDREEAGKMPCTNNNNNTS